MNLGFAGLSILVTGGSSGIGLAAARLLLAEGAMVTICGRDRDRLRSVEQELATPQLSAVDGDVTDPEAVSRVVDAAVRHGSRLDGVAAVAGRGRRGSLLELDPTEVVDEVTDKLRALLHVIQAAVEPLRATRGAIVALVAPTGLEPDPAMGAVGVGRAALANAVRALGLELADDGVRVNAVGVGLIDTPRQRAIHEAAGVDQPYDDWLADEAARRRIPLQRAGTDEEVAHAIAHLLSPRSRYTTGAVLDVTGGLRSR